MSFFSLKKVELKLKTWHEKNTPVFFWMIHKYLLLCYHPQNITMYFFCFKATKFDGKYRQKVDFRRITTKYLNNECERRQLTNKCWTNKNRMYFMIWITAVAGQFYDSATITKTEYQKKNAHTPNSICVNNDISFRGTRTL